jgi:hypothetical protein
MANVDGPHGFRPLGHNGGGTPGRLNEYGIATGYATNIFFGDMVKLLTGGVIDLCVADEVGAIGVFQGVSYVDAAGEQQFSKYWPASTTATSIKALVADDPNELFVVQCDGTVALTDMGANANLIATHAGSTVTGRSKQEVSATTLTGTAQLRMVRLYDAPDNSFATANPEIVVRINEHRSTNRTGI